MEQKRIEKPSFLRFNFSIFYYAAIYPIKKTGINQNTSILLTGYESGSTYGLTTQGSEIVRSKRAIKNELIPLITYCNKGETRPATEEELIERLREIIPPFHDAAIPALNAAKRVNVARRISSEPLEPGEAECLDQKFGELKRVIGAGNAAVTENYAFAYLASALRIAVKYSGNAYIEIRSGKEKQWYDPAARRVIVTLDADAFCRYLAQETTDSLQSRMQSPSLTRDALRLAGERQWQKQARQMQGIFFAGSGEPDDIFPAYVSSHGEDPSPTPLTEVLKTSYRHCFLLGQGGAGKTTALRNIADQIYGKDKSPSPGTGSPIYLDLSSAPDTGSPIYAGGRSTFIRRFLYRVLTGEDAPADEVILRAELDPILTDRKYSTPAILLLLDGINEMSRRVPPGADAPVAVMVQREIADIAAFCPNVRIVLAGRVDDGILDGKNILRYDLCELTDEIIRRHLTAHLPPERADAVMENPALLSVLRLPLFLSVYIRLKDTGEADTQGELLHIFFGERKTDSTIYTTRGRSRQIEENLKQTNPVEEGRLTAELQAFIIDFILPEIAWQMEDRIWIHGEGIGQAIGRILDDKSETAVRSWVGSEVFAQYRDPYNPEKHTDNTAQLLEMLGSSRRNLTDKVLAYCRFNLGILQYDRGNYRFSHQIFRDYFAAVKVINAFRIAAETHKIAQTLRGAEKAGKDQAAFTCLSAVLGSSPLDSTVRRMVGEILGEHRNVPLCRNGQWILPPSPYDELGSLCRRMLDVCREQQGNNASCTVFNVVQIMRESRRGDLSGLDFSGLDLRRCTLNGTRLARPGLTTQFAGAQITRDTLFPTGHTSIINTIAYHPNSAAHMLITASSDHTAKIWDARTGACMGTLRGHRLHVAAAAFHPRDLHYALTASYDGTAKIWDCHTLECIQTLDDHDGAVLYAAYRPDGAMIATASGGTVRLWELSPEGKYVCTNPLDDHPALVHRVLFHPNGDSFLALYGKAGLRVWHQRGNTWSCTDADCHALGLKGSIVNAVYHPDGHRILVSAGHPTYCIELDAHTLKPLGAPRKGTASGFSDLVYSPDGKKLISADFDLTVQDAEHYNELLRVSFCHKARFFLCPLAISPDGTHVAIGFGTSVEIRDFTTGERRAVLNGFQNTVKFANYHPAGDRLVMIGDDGAASLWSADRREDRGSPGFTHLTALSGEEPMILAEFHPDPEVDQLLTVSDWGMVSLWNTATEKRTDTFREIMLKHAAYSRDGKCILLSSDFNMGFALWDPNAEVLDHTSFPVCFSADGQILTRDEEGLEKTVTRYLSVSGDGKTLSLWRLHIEDPDQSPILLPESFQSGLAPDDCFVSAAFSPNGRLILSARKEGTLTLYDSQLQKAVCTANAGESLSAACFNHDGTRAAVSTGHSISLFEIQGEELVLSQVSPFECPALINSMTFSPDGKYILTALDDGTCRILDAQTLECLQTIPHITGLFVRGVDLSNTVSPDLTGEERNALRLYGAQID